MRTSKAVGRRANWKRGEVGRQTEENDEQVVVGHGLTEVQLIRCAVDNKVRCRMDCRLQHPFSALNLLYLLLLVLQKKILGSERIPICINVPENMFKHP